MGAAQHSCGDGGPFAIDISSRRVQGAAHVIDGVRNGQHLGALVGYQIERDLAEAGLARFQLSLRAIAPLVARRLHDADGSDSPSAQEAVAATNVVDGTLLLRRHAPDDPELKKKLDARPANAYLAPGAWKPLEAAEWAKVTGILRRAADTIDAVADLMLSEAVLQFANGNAPRAAAAMDAMSTGASPSDTLDVLETSEAGERLTHRVLAIVGARPPGSAWNANRPRALVEPRLEAWAAAHLGDPRTVVVAEAGRRLTLDEAGMAALDLVFATDPRALDRALRMAIPALAETALAVKRDPAWPKELRAIGQVIGLAGTLRAIVAGAHAILPSDLTRPNERPARDLEAAIPDLVGRVTDLAASLGGAVAALASTVALIPADGMVRDLDAAAALTRAAYDLEPFGIPLQPTGALPLDVAWVHSAWHVAEARSLAVKASVDRLKAMPAGTPAALMVEAAQEAVGTVFGDGFLVVPLLEAPTGADAFVTAATQPAFPAPRPTEVRQFVRDLGTVRIQMTRLSEVLLLGGALGQPRGLSVVQLSERDDAGKAAPGTMRWLAGALPPAGPWPTSPVVHAVLDQVGTVSIDASVAGLVIDGWVEDLPAQVGPRADPLDPRPGRLRTGLSIRCNSASARAPQVVLCAVSPDGKRWKTDSLRRVVEQVLDLARVRLVTLERLLGEGLVLPALYTRSSSLQGEDHIAFEELAKATAPAFQMPFVKDSRP
jgi:hypothetical protein